MVQHTDCAEEAEPTILITTCLVPTEGTALPRLNTHNTSLFIGSLVGKE